MQTQGSYALTFDDGPDPAGTDAVLAALRDAGARATFFCVGERVRAHPRLTAALVGGGHGVQLHCHRHVRHTDLDEAAIAADTAQGLGAFADAGLSRPELWRTPWGVQTDATRAVAAREGLTLVGWTHDTHDWRGDDSDAMLAALQTLRDGAVVLAHDGLGPGALRTDCGETARLTVRLVAAQRARGLDASPLAQGRRACAA